MPGFLSGYDEIVTVYIDDAKEWWVAVRKHLPRRDFKAAQAALLETEMVQRIGDANPDSTADVHGKVDSGAYQDELVVRAVTNWNLTDDDGTVLPLQPDAAKRTSVDRLPEAVFQKILVVIEGATRRQNPEAAKNADDAFRRDGAGGPVEPGQAVAARAGGVSRPPRVLAGTGGDRG